MTTHTTTAPPTDELCAAQALLSLKVDKTSDPTTHTHAAHILAELKSTRKIPLKKSKPEKSAEARRVAQIRRCAERRDAIRQAKEESLNKDLFTIEDILAAWNRGSKGVWLLLKYAEDSTGKRYDPGWLPIGNCTEDLQAFARNKFPHCFLE